jgi:hypothetical protein
MRVACCMTIVIRSWWFAFFTKLHHQCSRCSRSRSKSELVVISPQTILSISRNLQHNCDYSINLIYYGIKKSVMILNLRLHNFLLLHIHRLQ